MRRAIPRTLVSRVAVAPTEDKLAPSPLMKISLKSAGSIVAFAVGLFVHVLAAPAARGGASIDREPVSWRLDVDGVAREALVYLPVAPEKSEIPAPLVFGFHGHGGNSRNAARSFRLHELWPAAIVVYPQGLPTPGQLTDPEGKRNGWQSDVGREGDRDLAFFDALLARLQKERRVDERRIYATGHSNGGGFTYLLWATRPRIFAAVAPSSAGGRVVARLTPKPAMHLAGRNDQLVKFAWQERTMQTVKRINGCRGDGVAWAPNATLFPSDRGAPFVAFIHDGGHQYPREAPELIVRFFQEHPAAERTAPAGQP